MKRLILFLSFFLAMPVYSYCQLYIWNYDNILQIAKEIENPLRTNIISRADYIVKQEPIAIVNRKKRFAPSAHYYEDMGPYWWPDPNNPDGAWVNKDGFVNPESKNYDDKIMGAMADRLRFLSIAFAFTNDIKYYNTACEQLRTWFFDTNSYMYPNLEYGQVIPGRNNNHGRATGLISVYEPFLVITESIRLLDAIQPIDSCLYGSVKNWFGEFLDWCLESEIGKQAESGGANTGLAYHVLKLNLAIFSGRDDITKQQTDSFLASRLLAQIADDGSMPEELKRTKSYQYSIYNLRHIVDFCLIQESRGNRYYRRNRGIINKAVDYLIEYIGHSDKWQYKQLTDWDSCEEELKRELRRLQRLKPLLKKYKTIDTSIKKELTINNILE